MAEDENVDVMPTELAERLGVVTTVNSPKQCGRRGRTPNADEACASPCSVGHGCQTHFYRHPGLRDVRPIPELEPFAHLLPPEVSHADPQEQARIFRLVFDAGIKAYHHLLQYVLAVGSGSSSSSVSSISTIRMFDDPADHRESPVSDAASEIHLISRLQSIDSDVMAENLTMIDRIDHAYETMIEVGGDVNPLNVSPNSDMSPQMLANTLGLFAGAALRRPPTRAVECVMAASQDSNAAPSDMERQDEDHVPPVDPCSPCEDGLLVLACAAGFTDLVCAILRLREATIFASESMDVTPLMEASAAGTAPVVGSLIEMNADVNAVSSTGNTPLIYAAAAGQVDCIRILLETDECDLHVHNDNGHDALMEAASAGSVEIVKMLFEAGAMPTFVNMSNEFKESPLTLASYKGHLDVVNYLLELRETKKVVYTEEEMHTALMEASMDGHVEVARVLLHAGAPVNMASESFESPLTLACCGGHDVLVKMLLDAGAYIEEPNDESYTPLMEAAREGHTNVVKVLLTHGAQVNAQTEETGETALTVAACGGYTDVLEELVKHGGDLELGGNTPLMEAAQEGHAQSVMFIVSASSQGGRCPNFRSHATTSLCLAAENGHQDVVEILYTAGAELNAEVEGRTPLMKAAKNGHTEIVTFLISKGANVNRKSSGNDATALSLACAAGHRDIVKVLLVAGADPNVELKDGVSCVLEAARSGYVEIVELMLDHSGVAPNFSPLLAEATKASAAAPAVNQPKAVATRRKKAVPTTAKAYTGVPPDPSTNGPPLYSPFSIDTSQQIPPIGNYEHNIDDARELYKHLAHIYNSRNSKNPSTGLPSDLPANTSHADILTEIGNVQALIAVLPPGAELRPEASIGSAENPPTTDGTAKMPIENGGPATDAVEPPMAGSSSDTQDPPVDVDAAATTSVATQSSTFLTSLYEDSKKNFPGLPLPTHVQYSATPANLSTTCLANPPGTLSAALASQTIQNMSPEQLNEILTFFRTHPHADELLSQFTSAWPSEHKKPSRKKMGEIIAAWEEECRRFYPDIRPPPTADFTGNSVLEQQTAALNETLKVLRPTVTSLPGGLVASTNNSTALPPVNYQGGTHRRTHSEGDEAEIRSQMAVGKISSFNVDKATESNNDTPLSLACSNGHKDMVTVLVKRGANIEHRDKKGFTPLILAATGGHLGVVEALLNAGANLEAQSERTKDTALSLACSGGRKEVVDLLLNRGANKEHRNVSDYTPLSLAASGGYVDIVNMLLNAGAEINSRTGSKLGISPLMLAAMNGHKDATRVLLEKGSDINAQIETNRNTALTLACFQGRTDVVRLLLQYKANVEHRAKTGLTPLMEAANGGYVEVGELLLADNADPNTTPVPSSRDTALTIAADKGHDKFVELLLSKKAAIDARNKKGCTALWLACHGGHLDTVQVLVRSSADVDAQDNRKVSPLMISFRKGFLRIVSYLVNHVKQYPSDQEMDRYLATLTTGDVAKTAKDLQELTKNCTDSMKVINKAKTAQAEQANKAAEDLLAELAEEEEQAKSKKQKKAKKRAEKKEKKAKKGDENGKPSGGETTANISIDNAKEHQSEESEDESESINTSRDESAIMDMRVPQVIEVPLQHEAVEQVVVKPKVPARRSRADAKGVPNGGAALTIVPTACKTPAVLTPTSPVAVPKPSPQSDEWVKASKKKSQSKTKQPAVSSQAQKDFFSDDSGAFGGWKDVELSRRRLNTLTVCNTVIARVIGRGGANINAIREATGASIEVEKQGNRRDQLGRQISIRGTVDTVRNATLMINGLIADNDITVNDVIRQVLRGNTSVASSSSESGSRPSVDIRPPSSAMATASTAKTPAAPTNVWQQRMAARQQQIQQAAVKEVPAAPVDEQPVAKIVSPMKMVEEVPPEVVTQQPVASPPPPPPAVSYSSEEELRKAPGYRPQPVPPVPVAEAAVERIQHDTVETRPVVEEKVSPIRRTEPDVIQSSPRKELGNLSFLDKPEIAQIWNADDDSSNEPAWSSQLLLSSLTGLSLTPQDWSLPEFTSSLSASNTPPSRMAPVSSSATSNYDWMASSTAAPSTAAYSRPSMRSSVPVSAAGRPENNALFNQLAAQLLNNQPTGTATSNTSNYYGSNSFGESSTSMMGSQANVSVAQKNYAAYQSATQEYENLNNILSSYNPSHYSSNGGGDFNSSIGYPSSPSTMRSVPSRMAANYAPPPGFGNVAPSTPMNANTTVPPPHLRQFFPGQLPPSQANSAFSLYNQQSAAWSKLNGGPPGGGSSWSGGWS